MTYRNVLLGFAKDGGLMGLAAVLIFLSTLPSLPLRMRYVFVGFAVLVILIKYADRWFRGQPGYNTNREQTGPM